MRTRSTATSWAALILLGSACITNSPHDYNAVAITRSPGAHAPGGTQVPLRTTSKLIRLEIKTQTYTVYGQSRAELKRSLHARGPQSGRHARTLWRITWRYPLAQSLQGCTTGQVAVIADVTYTLPQWQPTGPIPQSLADRWRRYWHYLVHHEDGHRDIAIRAGEEVKTRLEAIAPASSCDQLRERADHLGRSIVARYRLLEDNYDLRTNHGATQGARFR